MTEEVEDDGVCSADRWAWNVVETFAFLHAQLNGGKHVGWTYIAGHYARCGMCEDWEISPSPNASPRARGTFGIAALATIGATFDAIQQELQRRAVHRMTFIHTVKV